MKKFSKWIVNRFTPRTWFKAICRSETYSKLWFGTLEPNNEQLKHAAFTFRATAVTLMVGVLTPAYLQRYWLEVIVTLVLIVLLELLAVRLLSNVED